MTTVSSRERSYVLADSEVPPPFPRVICGVDGTSASREAIRQAATLSGPGGRVEYVRAEPGAAGDEADDGALANALAVAGNLGAEPSAGTSTGAGLVYSLLERAGPKDLIVVGVRGDPTTLLHRAPGAVLIARPVPSTRPFPRDLLVASDGLASSRAAIRLSAAVARRHHALVSHLHVGAPDAARGARLADERRLLEQATGSPPVTVVETGAVPWSVGFQARERRCSLLVVGSRGLRSLRAPMSVSDRLVHDAPCSVLVAPPDG